MDKPGINLTEQQKAAGYAFEAGNLTLNGKVVCPGVNCKCADRLGTGTKGFCPMHGRREPTQERTV